MVKSVLEVAKTRQATNQITIKKELIEYYNSDDNTEKVLFSVLLNINMAKFNTISLNPKI